MTWFIPGERCGRTGRGVSLEIGNPSGMNMQMREWCDGAVATVNVGVGWGEEGEGELWVPSPLFRYFELQIGMIVWMISSSSSSVCFLSFSSCFTWNGGRGEGGGGGGGGGAEEVIFLEIYDRALRFFHHCLWILVRIWCCCLKDAQRCSRMSSGMLKDAQRCFVKRWDVLEIL